MSVAAATYLRSIQDARRIGESFRAATKKIDGKSLRAKLESLAQQEIPETQTGKHTTGYVKAIMEVATEQPATERADARAFATAFVSKDAAYSRTKAGLAAIQLEAWIIENGGTLYGQFVETVLDSGDAKFLTIFQGRLTEMDKERLRSGTGAFVKMEAIAEAGMVNYDAGDLLEFSMFDCTAVGKPDKNLQPKDATLFDQNGTIGSPQFASESVAPTTREEYDRVCESGGASHAAVRFLYGNAVDEIVMSEGKQSFRDTNNVLWTRDEGANWMPDVTTLQERDHAHGDDDEDEPEGDDEETCESTIYEINPRTHAARSLFHSWAAFTSEVIAESGDAARTIIVVGGKAYGTPYTLRHVREVIDDTARPFVERDDPAGGDARVEECLQTLVTTNGTLCENSAEVVEAILPEADEPPPDEEEPDTGDDPPEEKPANPS